MRSAAVAGLLLLAAAARSEATPCAGFGADCQAQVMTPIGYSGWQTQGWAYYCTGDHPYYLGPEETDGQRSFSFDNSCFTVLENGGAEEGNASKFDALITNWCLNHQQLTVTLACSSQPPP